MSDETERENLAKAEQWLARIVDGFRPPMETSMDKAATIQDEYDWRGAEIARLEAERDEALGMLRELVAGADDSRCWWIPAEIEPRIQALVERTRQGDADR